jgi:glycosyltransferase involved in cell wall biosynthesis
VVTVHSSFVSQPVMTRSSEGRVRKTMTGVDALIAVGPSLASELKEIEPDCRPLLIPNLVDDIFFSPNDPVAPRDPEQPLRVLGIGALVPAKRYDLLLRAVAMRRDSGASIALTLVGRGPERERLEQEAERLDIGLMVTLAGGMDRRGVRDHLRDTDVLVHPSRYETFGVVLIEAMACGVPVIATRSGGPDWVVEPETGQLVDVDDAAALAEAMRRLANGTVSYDPSAVRDRAVERFGAERVAAEIGDVYEGVLASRAKAGSAIR